MTAAGWVEELIGGPPITMTLAGSVVPPSAIGPLGIRRGRASIDARPDAAVATVELLTDQLVTAPLMGDALVVELSPELLTFLGLALGHQARQRFTGQVTDLVARPRSRRQPAAVLGCTATGRRSRLGQIDVGGDWPVELDGARAQRILTAAAADDPRVVLGTIDPGQYQVLARAAASGEVDAQGLLDQLAADTGGELVELRSGALAWRDVNSRANLLDVTELTAANVKAPTSWAQKLAGLVNRLTLGWGPASPQAEVVVSDEASRDQLGRFSAKQATQLADGTEAASRAVGIVGRRSLPRWTMPALEVDQLRTVDVDQAAALAAADFGDQLSLAGLPSSGPIVSARVFLEGCSELFTRDAWTLSLDVSDYTATGPSTRYADIPSGAPTARWDWRTRTFLPTTAGSGVTYADLAAAASTASLTYLQAVAWDFGDAGRGRYIDQPADARFATTDPALTYANAPT